MVAFCILIGQVMVVELAIVVVIWPAIGHNSYGQIGNGERSVWFIQNPALEKPADRNWDMSRNFNWSVAIQVYEFSFLTTKLSSSSTNVQMFS